MKERKVGRPVHDPFRVLLIAVLLTLVMPMAAAVFVGIAGVSAAAGTIIGGTRQTNTPTEHLVRDVDMALTYLEPADFPFTTLLQRLNRARRAEQNPVEWEEIGRLPRTDLVSGVQTAGGAGDQKEVPVDNPGMWRKNDLIAVWDNATQPAATLLVEEVTSSLIKVRRLPLTTTKSFYTAASFGTVPALADDEKLYWIGNTKTERDKPSPERAMMPVDKFAFIHTFDATVTVSGHKKRTKNYTENDWKRIRRDYLLELRKTMETNFWFGKPSISVDTTNNETRHTMGGFTHYITDDITYTIGSLTESKIVDIIYEVFTGNNGSKRRVLFGGKGLCADFDKIQLAKLQNFRDETLAGVRTNRISGRPGDMYIVYHPLFDEMGKEDWGAVVDIGNSFKRDLQPMEKTILMLRESGQADADGEFYQTMTTLVMKNIPTHRIIRGTA